VPAPEVVSELDELRQEVANLKRLQEVIHFLGGAPDLLTLRTELLDLALSLSGLKRGMLALAVSSDDDGSRRFKVQVKRGFEDSKSRSAPETKVLRKMLNRALEAREMLIEGDIRREGILGHAARRGLKLGAVACLPLEASGDLLGAVLLDDPDRTLSFSAAEEDLLRSFARHSAVALSRVASLMRSKRRTALLERRNQRLEAEADGLAKQVKKVSASSSRLRKHDRAGQEMRRLMSLGDADAKRSFTGRYLAHVMRLASGDLRRASEMTGLPIARLIGLLEHLSIRPSEL
jgi:GAF domain-containing protein